MTKEYNEKLKQERLGEEKLNNRNEKIKIIKYNTNKDIDVIFEDGTIIKNKGYKEFKNGSMINPNLKNKVGESYINKYGEKVTIIRYENCHDIDVEFENGYIAKNTRYDCFKNDEIRNKLMRTTYGVGFFGNKIKDTDRRIYAIWTQMLRRSYDNNYTRPTYKGCSVCEEWHNFQNFAKWYNENYYQIDHEIMCLDKDILIKWNKAYGPETCIIVPSLINGIFTKRQNQRGKYPIGVSKRKNKYYATCSNNEENKKFLGYYNTPEEAFISYKIFKESYIKQIADDYKSKYQNFPQKLYNTMYNYKVEITD